MEFGTRRGGFWRISDKPISSGAISTVHVAKRVRSVLQSRPLTISAMSPCEVGSEIETVAAKVFWKGTGKRSADEIAYREAALLSDAQRHPNIISFHGVFKTPTTVGSHGLRLVIAMEWFSRGDLHDNLLSTGPFSEEHAAEISVGILAAVAHIHARGIVHRDIKAENILVGDYNRPVLSDFGISCRVDDETDMQERCGSPGYAAPEVLDGSKYDVKVDVFSTGALLYFMLCRSLPFCATDIATILSKTLRCKIGFAAESFQYVSHHMKQFIKLLMQREPRCRLSAHRAMQIMWSRWCRNRLESAEWLRDIKSQVEKRSPRVQAWRTTAQVGQSLEHMISEGIENPGGDADPSSTKDVVFSDSGHSGSLKVRHIPAVASTTDVSSTVERNVAGSTSVAEPAASDATVEDSPVVQRIAQQESECHKGSRLHKDRAEAVFADNSKSSKMNDSPLQAEQRIHYFEAGSAAAQVELSPENVISEGIANPSSDADQSSVKDEVFSAASVHHSDFLKVRHIPAVASTTDVSSTVECEITDGTSVFWSAASDAILGDSAVVQEMAQEEAERHKGSRLHADDAETIVGGNSNSSKMDDILSQAEQRFPCFEAGRAAALVELASEPVVSEGAENPSGDKDPRSVKYEVLSDSGANHSVSLKSRLILAVASAAASSLVECEVADGTPFDIPAASDATVEDFAVIQEMAQEKLERGKSSGMLTDQTETTVGGHSSPITCSEGGIVTRQTFLEISSGRQDMQEVLTSSEPELIQENRAKPLRFVQHQSSKMGALSGSAADAEQPTKTPRPPSLPNKASSRSLLMWRTQKKEYSTTNSTFRLKAPDADIIQETRNSKLEDAMLTEFHTPGSASSHQTPMAPGSSITNRVQRYVFRKDTENNDGSSAAQSGQDEIIARGRRFFKPIRANRSETGSSDDGDLLSSKERPTDSSARSSDSPNRWFTYKSDLSEGESSNTCEPPSPLKKVSGSPRRRLGKLLPSSFQTR